MRCFFLKEIELYSCNINFVYKYMIFEKNKNVFPSIADSNRCTREFSPRRSTVHLNLKGTQL